MYTGIASDKSKLKAVGIIALCHTHYATGIDSQSVQLHCAVRSYGVGFKYFRFMSVFSSRDQFIISTCKLSKT
jgi:hypothetical protein